MGNRCRRGGKKLDLISGALGARRSLLLTGFVIRDRAPSRAFEVVILAAPERPEECQQPDKTQSQRKRHEDHQDFHDIPRGCALSAFSMTSRDEPDIAAAAISGVTRPAIAIGTASRL